MLVVQFSPLDTPHIMSAKHAAQCARYYWELMDREADPTRPAKRDTFPKFAVVYDII